MDELWLMHFHNDKNDEYVVFWESKPTKEEIEDFTEQGFKCEIEPVNVGNLFLPTERKLRKDKL